MKFLYSGWNVTSPKISLVPQTKHKVFITLDWLNRTYYMPLWSGQQRINRKTSDRQAVFCRTDYLLNESIEAKLKLDSSNLFKGCVVFHQQNINPRCMKSLGLIDEGRTRTDKEVTQKWIEDEVPLIENKMTMAIGRLSKKGGRSWWWEINSHCEWNKRGSWAKLPPSSKQSKPWLFLNFFAHTLFNTPRLPMIHFELLNFYDSIIFKSYCDILKLIPTCEEQIFTITISKKNCRIFDLPHDFKIYLTIT